MSIFGVKRGQVVDEDILSNAILNMDGKRIINVAYPLNPAYNGDVVTAKALSDFRKYLLDEVSALLLWFFGDFRCGALLFVVIHVIYKYKNR